MFPSVARSILGVFKIKTKAFCIFSITNTPLETMGTSTKNGSHGEIATKPTMNEAVIERLTEIETLMKGVQSDLSEIKQSLNHTVATKEWVLVQLEKEQIKRKLVESKVRVITGIFAFIAATLGGLLLAALFGGLTL